MRAEHDPKGRLLNPHLHHVFVIASSPLDLDFQRESLLGQIVMLVAIAFDASEDASEDAFRSVRRNGRATHRGSGNSPATVGNSAELHI